jgi:uncharacterized protein
MQCIVLKLFKYLLFLLFKPIKMDIMNTRNNIDLFLNGETLAIAGVSRDPKKFGNIVFQTLKNKGIKIVPINPNSGEMDGIPFVNSISSLDPDIQKLLIVTNKKDTLKATEEAIIKGIKNIWIQNGCETTEAINLASTSNVNLISKACILMYANPTGFHKFHQVVTQLLGGYVK